jgi:hypothetical protein
VKNLPSPKKGAPEVAKLATGIVGAIAATFITGGGVFAPIAAFVIEKLVNRAQNLLIEELKRGNVGSLTDDKVVALIPMAYRFFEAAKEGEYEHNLRLLAEFIKCELQMDEPDPSSFKRMARRLEGLSPNELKVIALIDASLSKLCKSSTNAPTQSTRPFVSAHQLADDPSNREHFDNFLLENVLNELAARGLLIPHGGTLAGKNEQYYYASNSFMELVEKASNTLSTNVL